MHHAVKTCPVKGKDGKPRFEFGMSDKKNGVKFLLNNFNHPENCGKVLRPSESQVMLLLAIYFYFLIPGNDDNSVLKALKRKH